MWTPIDQCGKPGARRLITVMLDSRCCQSCGCCGRCTRNAVWQIIAWSVASLKKGRHPKRGPFGEPLRGKWKELAGKKINVPGEVSQLGGDMEAFSDVCGFRRWNHLRCPCAYCDAKALDMHEYSKSHKPLTCADYDAAKADRSNKIPLHVGTTVS